MSPLVGGKPTSVFTAATQAKEPAVGAEGVTTLEDIEMRYHLTMAYLTLIKASVPFENIGTLRLSPTTSNEPSHS
jgi:hypothetical protein